MNTDSPVPSADTPTPRTDAAYRQYRYRSHHDGLTYERVPTGGCDTLEYVEAEFARTLERELAQATRIREIYCIEWSDCDAAIKAICEKHGISSDFGPEVNYFKPFEECVEELSDKLSAANAAHDEETYKANAAIQALEHGLAEARMEVEKLQAFKTWVHEYLDKQGVPHHPEGTHGAEGCRIGDRMDWLMAEVARLRRDVDVALLTAHRACHAAEHDPINGRIHGYCIVCGLPWPCEIAKTSRGLEIDTLAARLSELERDHAQLSEILTEYQKHEKARLDERDAQVSDLRDQLGEARRNNAKLHRMLAQFTSDS